MSQPDYEREGAALAAIAQPEESAMGSATMRPLTSGSAALCALCGNRAYQALTGDTVKIGALNDYDLLEFVWIHAAPLADVRRGVCLSREEVRARVLSFGETLDFGVLFGARKALEVVKAQLAALGVEVEARPLPGGAHEERPPLGE